MDCTNNAVKIATLTLHGKKQPTTTSPEACIKPSTWTGYLIRTCLFLSYHLPIFRSVSAWQDFFLFQSISVCLGNPQLPQNLLLQFTNIIQQSEYTQILLLSGFNSLIRHPYNICLGSISSTTLQNGCTIIRLNSSNTEKYLESVFPFCVSNYQKQAWIHKKLQRPFDIHKLTSPTDDANILTIFSCGTATTLCPLISMIRWPTLTPPRSAIPPRSKLHI